MELYYVKELRKHDIISARELDTIEVKLEDVERYLTEKNEKVEEEVTSMGDEDDIPYSHRVRAEGRTEGSNAFYNAIQKLKVGATQEDLKAEGFDEHILELALACK